MRKGLNTLAGLFLVFLVFLAVTVAFGAACVQIDGGAVEVSWVLRTADGRPIPACACTDPPLSGVQLVLRPIGGDGAPGADICAGRQDCGFACTRQRGATPFMIPAGRYAIGIDVVDGTGNVVPQSAMSPVRVPAPILRDVVFGRLTQLDAVAIQAGCSAACNGNPNSKICER